MFHFGVFFDLHVGKEISATEVLAAGLQRQNMIACEEIKDIKKNKFAHYERKSLRIFHENRKRSKKIGHTTP